jgi:hypothetical protein
MMRNSAEIVYVQAYLSSFFAEGSCLFVYM